MSKQDSINAKRDYANYDMLMEAEGRIGSRTMPLGGFMAGLKRFGSALKGLVVVPGALVVGYGDAAPDPEKPAVPVEFKGTDLEKSINDSWEINKKEVEAKVLAHEKLLDLDIKGYWTASSVAANARLKDEYNNFPEEAEARRAASSSSSDNTFVSALAKGAVKGAFGRG